jgi:hypothetical protein
MWSTHQRPALAKGLTQLIASSQKVLDEMATIEEELRGETPA